MTVWRLAPLAWHDPSACTDCCDSHAMSCCRGWLTRSVDLSQPCWLPPPPPHLHRVCKNCGGWGRPRRGGTPREAPKCPLSPPSLLNGFSAGEITNVCWQLANRCTMSVPTSLRLLEWWASCEPLVGSTQPVASLASSPT